MQAFQPLLEQSDIASVTCVNSLLALQPEEHMIATSAARAALLNMTLTLSKELVGKGIRVNGRRSITACAMAPKPINITFFMMCPYRWRQKPPETSSAAPVVNEASGEVVGLGRRGGGGVGALARGCGYWLDRGARVSPSRHSRPVWRCG